jgi:hypothetical protein
MKKKGFSNFITPFLVFSFFTSASTFRLDTRYPAAAPTNLISQVSSKNKYPYLQTVQEDDQSVTLVFTPATPVFEPGLEGTQLCESVYIPGLSQNETADLTDLPVQGAMLGIPPEGDPTVEVLEAEPVELPARHNLCQPAQQVLRRAPLNPHPAANSSLERIPASGQDSFMPVSPVELVTTGYIRGQRFLELRVSPLQYNPAGGSIIFNKRILVKVNFNSSLSRNSSPSLEYPEGPFEDSLRDLLLNYDQARYWRSQPAAKTLAMASAPQSLPPYKILVDNDGIYQLTYQDLFDAGVPVDTLDPRTLHIYNQDIEIAFYVEGEDNGIFEAGEYLVFYGQKVNTKYTDTNIYWLSWGGANGLRMTNQDGTPLNHFSSPTEFLTTVHAETDTDYYSNDPSGSNNDHWYWKMVSAYYYAGDPHNPPHLPPYKEDFTTDLEHISSGNQTINLRGLIKGFFSYDSHHILISLNGQQVDDHIFPYGAEYEFDLSIPQSNLVEGTNTLTVECPLDLGGAEDDVLFNWFEIDYYDTFVAENNRLFFDGDNAGQWEYHVDGFSDTSLEVFDITDPLSPVSITGGNALATTNGYQLEFEDTISGERHYLAQTTASRIKPTIILDNPSAWKSDTLGADYIIISHADFLSQVQPLADFRSSQGYRVQVIDVQDLYDEFSGGIFDPAAIRTFLEYAYTSWQPPAPSFVLFVGDGNFDYKNSFGWNEPNYIPPYLVDADPFIGEVPADNRYVSVSGSDILPDMYTGRFPVRTPTEAQIMVQKTLNYEQSNPPGSWNEALTFVADNADSGGNFPLSSESIINSYVPSSYTVGRIYYGINYTSPSSARTALINAINQGSAIVHYAGHAGTQQWASENLFRLGDLAALTNSSWLPFFIPMTCQEGYFIWPSSPTKNLSSLGESIVRLNNGGAIASWSPAGYGVSTGHDRLDRSLFNNLFNNYSYQLGYLTTQAKYDLFAQTASFLDLIETYHLFGDPALFLQMGLRIQQKQFLPLAVR